MSTREQAAMNRQAELSKQARIQKAHAEDPDLTIAELAERFGMSERAIRNALRPRGKE